jgi:bacillolysin
MRMTTRRKLYSVGTATAVVALLIWFAVSPRGNSPANGSAPPVEKLRAFSLTNAPSAPSAASWSTNQPGNPAQAQVIRQVAAQVLAKQSTKVTANNAPATGGFPDAKQAEAMKQLQQRVGSSLQVYLRPENSTPMQLKGRPLAKAVASVGNDQTRNEATAKTFLRDNAALMLLNEPDQELALAHRQADELGGEVLRFTQHYQGLVVWPAEIAVHLDANGDVAMVDGAYIATPEQVTAQPTLKVAEVAGKAHEAVKVGATSKVGTPELIVYAPMDQPAKLAWKANVSAALDEAWWVLLDAQTGEPITTISRVMHDSVSGSGVDLLGTTRPLNVWQSGPTYYMIDASKPMFNSPTGNGIIEVDDARGTNINVLQGAYYVTSASANSWSVPDAVSASYNLGQTYDYYQLRFGRSSFNGSGSNLNAIVRIGNYPNASWNGELDLMLFGNADRYAGSLDVIGHEVTHGVVSSIGSQGVLFYQNQPGALNEAFADIFGEMIEARTRGTNDWLMGSELTGAIRSMVNPASFGQPAHMNQFVVTTADQGGVHINSGIINRAYFLLAAGLRNAVGHQQAESIFYRCLTVSMKPFSQFVDARLGCVAAAETLFGVGSQQALKTAEAFDAVGLFAAPTSAPQPSNVNAAVAAVDSYMFIREHWFFTRDDLIRYEAARGDSGSGSSLLTSVNLSRPSVTGDGADMFLVGGDDSLCYITTVGTNFNTLYSGLVHSIAVSPEGRYVAFVFNSGGVPTNQIVLIDLVSNITSTVNLVTPVTDGAPLNNISYADALSFSPDGKVLIYDALSRLRGADGQTRFAWSIFGLDLATLQQKIVVPTVDEFNIGNPSFSKTSSRFVVFEAQYTTGDSAILTLDLYEGALGVIGLSENGVGHPVFNGDDTRVFYADEDLSTSSDRSVYVQNLGADKLTTSGNRALAISDAKLAVIYRRGNYPSINTAPGVTLTSPTANAAFIAPATVQVTANASDLNGTVTRVEFYSGGTLLFTDTTASYGMTWANLPAGVYTVYARAYDNQGASSITAPVRFTVNPPAPAGILNRVGAPGFELTLKVSQPGLYRLEASTNLLNWVSLGSFYCHTNLSFLDSSATNLPQRFYRAVSIP